MNTNSNNSAPVVRGMCLESYPCQHYVEYEGETKLMLGTKIAQLLQKLDLPVPPHFQGYLDEKWA